MYAYFIVNSSFLTKVYVKFSQVFFTAALHPTSNSSEYCATFRDYLSSVNVVQFTEFSNWIGFCIHERYTDVNSSSQLGKKRISRRQPVTVVYSKKICEFSIFHIILIDSLAIEQFEYQNIQCFIDLFQWIFWSSMNTIIY